MGQQEFDRTRFILRKLLIHMIEKEGKQLSDVIGQVITLMLHWHSGYNYKIFVCLRVYAFASKMRSQLWKKNAR